MGTWASESAVLGGSANGDLLLSTGEYTAVASANLGVRGTLSEDAEEAVDESLEDRGCVRGGGHLLFVGGAKHDEYTDTTATTNCQTTNMTL